MVSFKNHKNPTQRDQSATQRPHLDPPPPAPTQGEAQDATYQLMRSGFWYRFLACDDGKRLVFNE